MNGIAINLSSSSGDMVNLINTIQRLNNIVFRIPVVFSLIVVLEVFPFATGIKISFFFPSKIIF